MKTTVNQIKPNIETTSERDLLENGKQQSNNSKDDSRKLTVKRYIGFTTGEFADLQKEYYESRFSSFSGFLRYRILNFKD